MLPVIKPVLKRKEVFPRSWQSVIFENYGLVSVDKIAKTLQTDEKTIAMEAERLGLSAVKYNPLWEEKGFITIIRNSWYLLPYSQIMTLLGYEEKRLEFVLQNEDFLQDKLGLFKPECEEVLYSPLTEEEQRQTETLAKKIAELLPKNARPFVFFDKTQGAGTRSTQNGEGLRILHGYLTPCGDAFLEDDENYLPDSLLQQYQQNGVNGLWVHGLLSALSPYPFDENASKQYPVRRKNLQKLVDRAAKYGIKIYLYINEPRGIAEEKLGKYAHLKGTVRGGVAHLCFERKEVREYLYNALKDLFENVHGLGGIITITMSENPTHCHSHTSANCNCPICKDIPPEKTASAVVNVIAKALKDSGSGAKTLAYLWGWSDHMGWTEEQTLRGISYLDKDVIALCPSEYDLEIEKGGVKSHVVDYSISNPGPSEVTKKAFLAAQERGLGVCAKIQTNDSWECSAVPYLPVFDLLVKHLENLRAAGVNDYMLTWTLGGYPSPMLDLVGDYARCRENFSLSAWYEKEFGQNAKAVEEASKAFCKGFQEYPFSVQALYLSPKTLGVANRWEWEREEKRSTMVCFAFDDYESWIYPYPYEVYISQFEKLLFSWEEGLRILENATDDNGLRLLKDCAEGAYVHFKSDYLHTKFSYYKRDIASYKDELLSVFKEEKEIAKRLLDLTEREPTIGYEAANHYFYNDRNIIEKILQVDELEKELEKKI